ncbi:MAG: hypothetical protein IT566_07420 [Rhodospirillaceae bacterium]|nr:hypothetical protein [Rhodospirillaceae bacterium]
MKRKLTPGSPTRRKRSDVVASSMMDALFSRWSIPIIELKRRCNAAQNELHNVLEKRARSSPRLVHADRLFGVWDKDAAGNYLTDLVPFLYREKQYAFAAREIYLTGLAARYLSQIRDQVEAGGVLKAELLELVLEAGAALKLLGYEFQFEADRWAEAVLKVKAHYEDEEAAKSPNGKANARLVAEHVARAFGKTVNSTNGFALIRSAMQELENKRNTA